MGQNVAQKDPPAVLPIRHSRLLGQVADLGSVRLVDGLVSLVTLLLLSPLLLVIAVAIKLDSNGPILVRETRLGRRERDALGRSQNQISTFQMYRFRSTFNPAKSGARPVEPDQQTRVGWLLYKTSLDELPQFYNVLRGDMSLIGPRPLVLSALNKMPIEGFEARFDVKPGLVGLWQVSRHHLGNFEEMAAVDLEYLRKRSFKLDLWIFLMTPKAILQRSNIQHWLDEPMLSVSESVAYNVIKRLVDILLSLSALALLSPIMLLVALMIRLDSPGPVIFSQIRMGRRILLFSQGKTVLATTNFRIYKFRTMYHQTARNDAAHQAWVKDWVRGKLSDGNNPQEVVKPKHDPRVTRVGRFLRATSLDELPQFYNVLRGDMSLVGPRPVPVYEVEAYETQHYARLDARPGITGLWQVNLRGRGTLDQMVELDVQYLKKRSLLMDLKIMFMTVPAVITGRGAK